MTNRTSKALIAALQTAHLMPARRGNAVHILFFAKYASFRNGSRDRAVIVQYDRVMLSVFSIDDVVV